MDTPYNPGGGLVSKLNRRWARLAARAPLSVDLDHAIVSFSFDDFPKSAALSGATILESHGWRGTYYASAGYAGTRTHHGDMFDAGDLQRLVATGHEIGCHTHTHIDGSRVGADALLADIERNHQALRELGYEGKLDSFAYPYGETTPAAKRLLAQRFTSLRGVHAAINRGDSDRSLLKSVPVDGGETGIARAVDAAESLVEHPGWLIFYLHDVQDEPTQWGCTPAQLERVCAAVERSGARVLTVAAAMAEIGDAA
ncbi:polysaccharide deacetylase family protein [Maricaulis salignorans]|uniref:polysaccharide deacetylase family protein n=1 Tax=Maricaulis salignorans TaxID=144026 RepID=UPI003A929B1D